MTILISLMSDTFLAKFQKGAEKFGVRGGEDERYIHVRDQRRARGSCWKYCFSKVFRRHPPPGAAAAAGEGVNDGNRGPERNSSDRDVERQSTEEDIGVDEYLRDDIMEEVKEIRRSVDQQVDAKMIKRGSTDRRRSSAVARTSEVEVAERNGARRRTWRDIAQDGDADDEGDQEQEDGLEEGEEGDDEDGIDEDEVQRAIHENRGDTSRSS